MQMLYIVIVLQTEGHLSNVDQITAFICCRCESNQELLHQALHWHTHTQTHTDTDTDTQTHTHTHTLCILATNSKATATINNLQTVKLSMNSNKRKLEQPRLPARSD